jgi:hypothetical protein
MTDFSHAQYDLLERSITLGHRISVLRRGTEFIVIPLDLVLSGRRELIRARHPSTGDVLTLYLDEIDHFEVIR